MIIMSSRSIKDYIQALFIAILLTPCRDKETGGHGRRVTS